MTDKPWWMHLIPDVRSWATIGMFALVFYLLHLIANNPELAENELFKTVATILLSSGGFGLLCAFLWGGSKASNTASEAINEVAKSKMTPVVVAPGTITTTTTPGTATPPGTATITTAPDVDVTLRKADEPAPSRARWDTENPEDPA